MDNSGYIILVFSIIGLGIVVTAAAFTVTSPPSICCGNSDYSTCKNILEAKHHAGANKTSMPAACYETRDSLIPELEDVKPNSTLTRVEEGWRINNETLTISQD